MFEIECPQCESAIGFGLADFFQQRVEQRDCQNCGAALELRNAGLFFVLNGMMFAGLIAMLGYWGFQREWIKVIIVVPVCWLTAPVLVQLVGQWRVRSGRGRDTIRAQRWSRVGSISGWIFGTAVALTAISYAMYFRKFVFSDIGEKAIEEFSFALKYRVLAGVGISIVALAVTIIAWVIKRRLSESAEDLYS